MRKDISFVCIFLCCGFFSYLVHQKTMKHRRYIVPEPKHISITRIDHIKQPGEERRHVAFAPGQEHLPITQNVTRIDTIKQPCEEGRHVAFLKVHKAGSTTVMNILQRFGEKRSLICAIPKAGNYLGWGVTIQENKLVKIPPGMSYNLLYNHVVYNRAEFRRVMPNNTVYVAIVREPLDLLESTIKYLQDSPTFKYLKSIPDNKLSNFLANPMKFEPQYNTFTNNRMAFDFGLIPRLLHDGKAIQSYLLSVSEDFDIVLVLEYFDESLILLKRKLCWSFEDILYMKNNVNKARIKIPFSQEDRQAHRAWAIADNMFYDFFYEKFWKTVGQESLDFYKEVKEFKIVLENVQSFCQKLNLIPVDSLFVKKTDFSSEFFVSYNDCKLMEIGELNFMKLTQTRLLKTFKEFN